MHYARAFHLFGWLLALGGLAYIILGIVGLASGGALNWSPLVLGLVAVVVGTAVLRWARRALIP